MTNIEVLKSRSLSSLQALHFWASDSSIVVHAWATSRNHAWPTRSPCSIARAMVSNAYMTPFMPTGRKAATACILLLFFWIQLQSEVFRWQTSVGQVIFMNPWKIVWVLDKSTKEISLPMSKTKRCLKHGFMTMFWSWNRKKWLTKKNPWISHPHSPGTPNFLVAWQQVIFPVIDWSWQVPSRSSRDATPEVLKSQWVYSQVHQWLFLQRGTTAWQI